MVSVIIKTPQGLEDIVATRIQEILGVEAKARPHGAIGIVFVLGSDPDGEAEKIAQEIPEAEKILPVYAKVEADPEKIADAAVKACEGRLRPGESFAVRTTRRGRHNFTSIDVNVVVGAKIKEVFGNPVNLDFPDKVIWVEIFGNEAYVSVTEEQVKRKPKENTVLRVLRKLSVIQLPFLGDLEGAYRMGVRIGRAAQAFEIPELIVALKEPVKADELKAFLEGLIEGAASRMKVQKRTYDRSVKGTRILIYELYQLARMRRGEPFIITSAKGEPLNEETCKKLYEIIEKNDRINVFIGAREGIPTGLFRWASVVVNLAPGITFATEHGIPTIAIALIACYKMMKEKENGGQTGHST